jgi:HK97 family phage major capsid protein
MNLKMFLDASVAAEARVQQIAAQIDNLMGAGETAKALEMKPQLDTVKAEAKTANELYLAMRDVDTTHDFKPVNGGVQVVTDEADQPFATKGEFFMLVKNAALYPGREDARLRPLKVKDATGMSEGVPAEGGYLLQPQVAGGVLERMYAIGQILSRVSSDPIGANSNSMTYNGVDETSRVAGSRHGGVLGYWMSEGGSLTGTKPKFYQYDLKLKKVAALCYATDEQLMDTANLESWLGRVVPDELRFMAEDAIYEGDGVGKPLGILKSPCLISQLRYTLATISYIDIISMWARRWAGVSDYVWLINQDVNPQLDQLYLTSTLQVPPNFLAYGPDGVLRMKGKEVLEVEYAATMGTVGDIVLASLSQYQTINKGAPQTASSIHVAFLTDETAFRFIYRFDGQPTWNSAVTPLHGSNTQSPFVALATATA